MKNRDRISASRVLDHKTRQLAEKHRQHLDEMTEAALATSPRYSFNWLIPQAALAVAALVVTVSIYWMLPPAENSTPQPTMQVAVIPDWVLDDQVPLEILESPEFYQWLAQQG